MLVNLALAYGLMMLTLYSGSFFSEKLEPLARILACGTVMCVSLAQLAA